LKAQPKSYLNPRQIFELYGSWDSKAIIYVRKQTTREKLRDLERKYVLHRIKDNNTSGMRGAMIFRLKRIRTKRVVRGK